MCDPFDRSVGFDIGKPTAHIVTISHQHPDHANLAAIKPMRENIFTIEGPGEYEVGGVMIAWVGGPQMACADWIVGLGARADHAPAR